MPKSTSDAVQQGCGTIEGAEYAVQTMVHKAVVQMDPLKLEMLDGFEKVSSGYKFTPEGTNARLIISGNDWSEKSILIYGSDTTKRAESHLEKLLSRIHEIGHEGEIASKPEIANLSVGGDLNTTINLEQTHATLVGDYTIEYEPEQFPALILKLDNPSASVLLFSTGSFVIQGLKEVELIESVVTQVLSLLDTV